MTKKPRWRKDAPDHWGADLPGVYLSLWGSSTGWVWELWPDDGDPDEPTVVGDESTFEEAKEAAARRAGVTGQRRTEMMTVQELIEQLNAVEDKDRVVILQVDGEGNGYSPLYQVDDEVQYRAETTWSGEIGYSELTPEMEQQGYGEEDVIDGDLALPALVLTPTN